MTDLDPEQGGETVFPKGLPGGVTEADIDKRLVRPKVQHFKFWESIGSVSYSFSSLRVSKKTLQNLRSSENGQVLKHGSWEEELVSVCSLFF